MVDEDRVLCEHVVYGAVVHGESAEALHDVVKHGVSCEEGVRCMGVSTVPRPHHLDPKTLTPFRVKT